MVDGSLTKPLLSHITRPVAVLCAVVVALLLPGGQALAASGPEAPLTDECVGVIMAGSVRICGILNPHTYAKAGYYFEYNKGAECTGGDTTPIEAEVEGQDIAVSAELTGLEPSTEYSYCLVATNTFGETISHPAGSPPGPPPPEAPITEAANEIARTTAKLNGELNPHASAKAGYYFMYNTGASCTGGGRTPAKAEVEGDGIAVSAKLTGLEPGTEYTFCLVATNSSGATFGQALTATTLVTSSPPEAPITETCGGLVRPAVAQPGFVQFCGALNPNSSAKVGYYFAYNTGTVCTGGSRTPTEAEVEGTGIKVSSQVGGLQPGTEYTYCLVATNPSGETFGQALKFETEGESISESPEAPITEACGGPVVSGIVRLCGVLNPGASAKVGYYFAYNKGGSCTGGGKTPAGEEVEGQGIKVSGEPTDLEPGTEYTYCLVATNSHGETFGEGLTFKTEGAPSTSSSSASSSGQSGTLSAPTGLGTSSTPGATPLVSLLVKTVNQKALTSTRKLAKALKVCEKKPRRLRASCTRQAYIKYSRKKGNRAVTIQKK